MATETRSDFVVKVEELLKSDDTSEVLKVFNDGKNEAEVKNNSWELIPVVTTFLTGQFASQKSEVFQCCENLINTIARSSNPEEALLQLIEEIEECSDDTKFSSLIKPLYQLILRIPKKRINSLAWGFNSIQSYLNKCELPHNEKLIGKEKLLLDTSDQVLRIVNLYNELLIFYNKLVSELPTDTDECDEQKKLICKFLVDLVGNPLVYLDMEIFDDIKSKARRIAEKIIPKILKVNCDPISLLKLKRNMKNGEVMAPNVLSKASLFYLIYHENIGIEQVPKVYDPLNFFHLSLELVNSLFDSDHYILIEKGLKLAESLLARIQHFKLHYLMLDSEHHSHFCKHLAKVIVYNEVEVLRKSALKIYKKYLTSFETHGFYLLVYNLMSNLNHSGLVGYTITLYKDGLVSEFSKHPNSLSAYFKGQKLMMLIEKFCYLHKNEETDLVEISDQIIASLNLLRYLAIRDKQNITEIWDHFKILQKSYFQNLRKGLDLSRAHYELKIREIKEAPRDKKNPAPELSIVVGGQNLNEMPNMEKLKVLESSLTVFDMIESLLTRLLECIEQNINLK